MKQGIFARAMAADSSEQIIDIIGVVGWEVGYQKLREILRAIPDGTKSVLFDIYSPGGDVWEGNGIVQEIGELSKRGIKTSAKIQVAASMATLIAVACDTRTIAANGRFLIHNAWAGITGDAAEMEKMAKTLRDCEQEAAKFYAERTGNKPDKMLELMSEERWMLPDETKSLGFVQEICDPFKPEEYEAVKQEIVAAGKWPKALVELPAEPPKKEEPNNADKTDAGAVVPAPAAAVQPVTTADDPAYIKGLAEGEKIRAEEQAKYLTQLAARDELIKAHQSAKDKAASQVLALEAQLKKTVADAESKLSMTVQDMSAEHAKQISGLTEKFTKDHSAAVNTLNIKISELRKTLQEANDRNSKLIAGAMTFEPTVTTWEEAMKACDNDYVKAAGRYPEILKTYIREANKTKGK